MAIVGVAAHGPGPCRMVGAKKVHRCARVHLRVEPNDDGTNTGKLVRTKSNDVPRNYFVPFYTSSPTPTTSTNRQSGLRLQRCRSRVSMTGLRRSKS
jgi:hypothetical protein